MTTATIGNNTGNTYSGTQDTWLREGVPTTNYDGTTPIEATKYNTGDWSTCLFKFTGLASISGPVTVSAATLYVYCSTVAGNQTITAKRILRNVVTNQATWNIYSTGNNWGTAGCFSDGTDRVAASSGAVVNPGSGGYIAFTNAQLISDVENMINGSVNNYGWLLERTDSQNDFNFIRFESAEGADGQRPYLDITYTASGSSPVLGESLTSQTFLSMNGLGGFR